MDERVERKLRRHAREGVTYPNRGALLALPPEVARFHAKLARHRSEGVIQGDETAAAPEPAPAERKPAKDPESKGSGKPAKDPESKGSGKPAKDPESKGSGGQ